MDPEDYEEIEKVRWGVKKQAGERRAVATREGQITGIGPRGCEVLVDGQVQRCKPQAGLAVGDRVDFDAEGVIRLVHPRATNLSRPDPMNPKLERVIAANVEVVVMVAAIKLPELRPGLIDRYLIAIEKGGSEPVLCITKIDIVADRAEFEGLMSLVEPYRNLGIRIFPLSTTTGEGVEVLREALAGKLAVLVGHSGVGKSSLMNALAPEVRATTGALSKLYQKGQHTTTSSTMYRLANGLRIIDTPGVREFGLWDLTVEEVERHFHDFDAFRGGCQFQNCTHTHEPVCGVRTALAAGEIPMARYKAYLRIRDDVGHT